MSVLETAERSLYYEEHGQGYPLVLFAPGGMHSQVQFWRGRPDAPDEPLPWIDPTVDLAGKFRVIAFDQRNAGRSRALVSGSDSWSTYASDAVALLDHLGIERTHAMGGCIGSSLVLGLLRAAPERVSAAVLQNPIGLTAENGPLFRAMFDEWSSANAPTHPEADDAAWASFGDAMFGGDFVFSVPREFVRRSTVPLLVLTGGDVFHPPEIAREIVELAPDAELIERWAGEELKPATGDRISSFLLAHTS